MFSLKFVILCVVFSQYVYNNKVNSVCCEAKAKFFCGIELETPIKNSDEPSCEDCNPPESHCGLGGEKQCNIMGCDCKKGCRKGPCKEECERPKRQVENGDLDNNADKLSDDVTDFIIEAADYDGDGYLNLTEAKFYVYRKQLSLLPENEVDAKIGALDKNNDGYLSVDEIDGRE